MDKVQFNDVGAFSGSGAITREHIKVMFFFCRWGVNVWLSFGRTIYDDAGQPVRYWPVHLKVRRG